MWVTPSPESPIVGNRPRWRWEGRRLTPALISVKLPYTISGNRSFRREGRDRSSYRRTGFFRTYRPVWAALKLRASGARRDHAPAAAWSESGLTTGCRRSPEPKRNPASGNRGTIQKHNRKSHNHDGQEGRKRRKVRGPPCISGRAFLCQVFPAASR